MNIPWYMHAIDGKNSLTGVYGTPVGTYVRSYVNHTIEVTFYPHDCRFIVGNVRIVTVIGTFSIADDVEGRIDDAVAADLNARLSAKEDAKSPRKAKATSGDPMYHKTRFPELKYGRVDKEHWSFFCAETGSRVGPLYASKAELLGDLTRYARENWGIE